MNLIQQAKDFLAKDLKFRDFVDAFYKFDDDLQEAIRDEQYARKRQSVDKTFEAGNLAKDRAREETSPSGRYRLVVTPLETEKGRWNYSQGQVFKVGSDEPVTTVRRNYGSFPFSWAEDHPNGHDYLVCGEDYQGQTVIELDTGKRRDFVPTSEVAGHGFCWAAHTFHAEAQVLVVDGCYWACPYEFRFFDFSDPMTGWPEIETAECIYAEGKPPEIRKDGTILTFQDPYDSDWEPGDPEDEKPEPVAIKTFRREGLKLILQEEWVAEEEQERREKAEESRRKYEQWLKDFRSSDPMYLLMTKTVKEDPFTANNYDSIGVCYEGWCPDFDKRERRICRRIIAREDYDTPGWTVDLEWAVETGPVKLVIFKDGKTHSTKWFEHSVEGMRKALSHARELVS